MASSTTRRHSRDDPREDVGEEVRVGVGVGVRVRVGAVECQLNAAVRATDRNWRTLTDCWPGISR